MLDEILARLNHMTPEQRAETEKLALAATRSMTFVPQPGPQTEAYLSKADVLLFGGSPGGGKRLFINEKIPVPLSTDPSGFKNHGELNAGDYVYSPTGKPVRVLKRHATVYDTDTYEVVFDTGEVILADAEHLWHTYTRKEREQLRRATPEWREAKKARRPSRAKAGPKNEKVSKLITEANRLRKYDIRVPSGAARTTKEILETLYVEGDDRLNHSIPVTTAIENPDAQLPVDPYLFGLWLGDGYTEKPYILMMTADWKDIEHHTPTPKRVWVEGADYNRKQEVEVRRFEELKKVVIKGVKKHIPIEYLRASRAQRLELLRGMCDTDGTCDVRGQVEVGFSNRTLAEDTLELVNSLGYKATMRAKAMKSKKHATHYRIKFMAGDPVFKLPRKLIRQTCPKRKTVHNRYIVEVRKTTPVPMNCLTVEGNLYLVGRTYITTHNTALGVGLALNEHHRSLVVRREFVDLDGVLHTLTNILKGDSSGLVGGNRPEYRKPDGGIIHFQGLGKDIGGKQGNARDYIYIDEAAQLPEDMVRMLIGWLRTDRPNQRCRVVMGSNPPLDAVGDWLIGYFAPWLDPTHPNPAKEGELRYFLPKEDGSGDRECRADEFMIMDGVRLAPQSRTFISSKYTDNKFYREEDYVKSLAGLPPSVRDRLMSGNFLLTRPDDEFQVIPTDWVRKAQNRWTPAPPDGVPQCAIGVDVAQGGCFDEKTEILTDRGWMFFKDLRGDEKVLTLREDVAEWGPITEIHRYRHDGYLNVYEARQGVNFAITDNHNLLVKSPQGKHYDIKRYDTLPRYFNIRRNNTWAGHSPEVRQFVMRKNMPNGGRHEKTYKFSMLDWARFLGWVVSEGAAHKEKRDGGRWKINISQNKGKKYDEIKSLLRRMGLKFNETTSRSGFELSNRGIGKWVAEHCGVHAANKKVPKEIKEAAPDVIEAFLEAYRSGDGTLNGGGTPTYFTTSKQLADDIQELLVKVGRSGKLAIKQRAGSEFYIGDRRVVRKHDVYHIIETKGRDAYIDKQKVKREEYHGTVYCVSTPLRTIMVRRNGATMWSGNSDRTVLAIRHDGWYAPLKMYPGVETPDGTTAAGVVISHRRNTSLVIVDIGGGWGGDCYAHLKANDIECRSFMGVKQSERRTRDNLLRFFNVRAEAYWRFREALDPAQDGGSRIALPHDPELLADLTTPRFEVTSSGIKITPKDKVVETLGRSPDKGDAVVMAWWDGLRQDNVAGGFQPKRKQVPKVVMGHAPARRRR